MKKELLTKKLYVVAGDKGRYFQPGITKTAVFPHVRPWNAALFRTIEAATRCAKREGAEVRELTPRERGYVQAMIAKNGTITWSTDDLYGHEK